jgi:hypothetical protein
MKTDDIFSNQLMVLVNQLMVNHYGKPVNFKEVQNEENQNIIMERQWNQGCAQKRIQRMVNGR